MLPKIDGVCFTDTMNAVETWHAEALATRAVEALKKNGFEAIYLPTGKDAADWIERLVSPGMVVGLGGSTSLREIGIKDRIAARGGKIVDHSTPGLSPEEKMATMRAELTSDLFLSSSNALTLSGELFNVDATGNRVASLTFGPKKTVVVVGHNKIVADVAEAEARARLVASPMNNKRLAYKNPCVETGVCVDCRQETRICRIYSVLRRRPMLSDFTVIVVGERLGY